MNIVAKDKFEIVNEAIKELEKTTTSYQSRIEVLHMLKDRTSEYMMEALENEAEHREHELKVLDRLMRERSEIRVDKCKGRDS